MELSRLRQRRKMRRLLDTEALDIDVLNAAFRELGMGHIEDDRAPKLPAVRLPRLAKRNGNGAVYIVKAPSGLYKIGASVAVNHRLQGLQTGTAEPLELVHVIETKQYTHFALERKLHERLSRKRVRGEWFSLDKHDVAALCRL